MAVLLTGWPPSWPRRSRRRIAIFDRRAFTLHVPVRWCAMRPLIALPSRRTDSADTWRVPATALGRPYQEAIIRAGGAPVAVPPLFDDIDVEDAATDVMTRVDALCLPGGPDVSSHRYGVDRLHPRLIKVCHEHDALDLALA